MLAQLMIHFSILEVRITHSFTQYKIGTLYDIYTRFILTRKGHLAKKRYLFEKHCCIQLLTVDVGDLMFLNRMNGSINFYHHPINRRVKLFLMLYVEINVYQLPLNIRH